ncbi:hypothetical protein JM654_08035 [Microbacterium oxydans]|nr:hypothetical protein [Microbacterium oxydans]
MAWDPPCSPPARRRGNVRDAGVTRARTSALQRAARDARLGIPLLIARDVIHGHRTVFPIPLGLAASFDADLVRETGVRAALEASADGITWTFAPMIDLVEDPRWGARRGVVRRVDAAERATGRGDGRGHPAIGRGRGLREALRRVRVSRGGRDYARVDVGEITLRNHHLIPFRAAVDAGVHTVMAAFSDVDGIPMHSHRHLIRDVLKGEWGFDGVVVADWNGIGELVAHGVARDLRAAAKLAIEAGVDVDMVSGAYPRISPSWWRRATSTGSWSWMPHDGSSASSCGWDCSMATHRIRCATDSTRRSARPSRRSTGCSRARGRRVPGGAAAMMRSR